MGAGLRPTAKAVDKPPDPTGGAPPADSTGGLSASHRGGAGRDGPEAAVGRIWVGTTPDPDSAHRVWPLYGGQLEESGLGQAGDV